MRVKEERTYTSHVLYALLYLTGLGLSSDLSKLNLPEFAPEFRLDKPTEYLHFPYTTPITPLAYLPSAQACGAPKSWFAWDYNESWDKHWTIKPMCVVAKDALGRSKSNTYCTFVSSKFANDRGIAAFTSVANAEAITKLSAFTDSDTLDSVSNAFDVGSQAYERKYFPGKGWGIVANRTIFRGERIMQEPVALVYDRLMYTDLDDIDRVPMGWHMIYQLPEEAREELMTLHVQDVGDQLDDVMRTNAFGAVYNHNDLHNNIFPRISRHNHDCRPNSHYYFDSKTMSQYLHAGKDIFPGEEIYLSYLDVELPYEERIAATQLSWGFTCQCSLCRQPWSHVRASDIRLQQIKNLKDELNDWSRDKPDRVAMALNLIDLYRMERLWVPIASAYESAAYAYNVAGDRWNAMKWAARAVEALTVFYGGDHGLTLDLEQMMLDPEHHRTWLWKAQINQTSAAEA